MNIRPNQVFFFPLQSYYRFCYNISDFTGMEMNRNILCRQWPLLIQGGLLFRVREQSQEFTIISLADGSHADSISAGGRLAWGGFALCSAFRCLRSGSIRCVRWSLRFLIWELQTVCPLHKGRGTIHCLNIVLVKTWKVFFWRVNM